MAMTEAALMNLTNKVLQSMVEGKGEVPKKKKADLVAQLLAIQEQEQVSRPTDHKSAKKWFSVAHELDMESGYPSELEEGNEYLTRAYKMLFLLTTTPSYHPTHRVLIFSIGAPETRRFRRNCDHRVRKETPLGVRR